MSYVIRISLPGYDVTDLSKPRDKQNQEGESPRVTPSMLTGLALPYLEGAREQLKRYHDNANKLESAPTVYTNKCLYEVSSLFENLGSIVKYVNYCNGSHGLDSILMDVRNHIRHDLRENVNDENHDQRKQRAENLGIPEKLITNIQFDPAHITVGSVRVTTEDISGFIDWAENFFRLALEERDNSDEV